MKRLLVLVCLLFSALNWAQQVNFEVTYLPNHTYHLDKTEYTSTIIDMDASKEVFEALKSQGIDVPIIEKDSSILRSITSTGTYENNSLPIRGDFLEFSQARVI